MVIEKQPNIIEMLDSLLDQAAERMCQCDAMTGHVCSMHGEILPAKARIMSRLKPRNPTPDLTNLSAPIEDRFLDMINHFVPESYDYGLNKYPIPLHTFNGRSFDWAEEWVSLGRYVIQIEMEKEALTLIVEQYRGDHDEEPRGGAVNGECVCAICIRARILLRKPIPGACTTCGGVGFLTSYSLITKQAVPNPCHDCSAVRC